MTGTRGSLRPRRLLAGLLAALAFAAIAASSASAHTTLARSNPGDGSVLSDAPRTISLWFDEELVPRFSSARILDAKGLAVGLADVRADARERLLVLTPTEELPHGIYSVDWKVLSGEDGHFRRGLVVFGIGPGVNPAAAGQRPADQVEPLDAVLRWLNLTLLAGLAGGVAVVGLVLFPLRDRGGAEALRRSRRRALSLAVWCAGLGLAVGLGLLFRQATTLAGEVGGGDSFLGVVRDLLGDTRLGALWIAREALLAALLGLLLALRGGKIRERLGLAAGGLLVVGLALVQALAGHAAGVSPRTGLVVVAATVHVLAAGLWVGGLAAAVVTFGPLRAEKNASPDLMRAYWRRFSGLAAVSVGLLTATGLYYAARQVASLDALVTTLYGQALLGKTALVLTAGAAGLANAMILRPRTASSLARLLRRPPGWTLVSPRRFGALVLTEVGIGIAVLAAAGVLTAATPAQGPEFAPAPRGSSANALSSRSSTVGDLLVTLSASPNRAGQNVFQVIAASSRRPAPAPIARVTLQFERASGRTASAPMLEMEPGRYRLAGGYLSAAGAWQVEVAVAREGLAESVARFDWTAAPAAGRAVVLSDRPLGPILTAAAAAVLLIVLSAAAWALRSRRPPRPREGGPRKAARPLQQA